MKTNKFKQKNKKLNKKQIYNLPFNKNKKSSDYMNLFNYNNHNQSSTIFNTIVTLMILVCLLYNNNNY